MKFLVVVAFVATIAAVNAGILTAEQKEQAKKYIAECKAEFPVTDEDIVLLKSGAKTDASEDVKCFGNCFLEKAGILKDGAIQEAAILAKFGPTVGEEKVKEVLAACRGETGSGKCDLAYNLHACFIKNKGLE